MYQTYPTETAAWWNGLGDNPTPQMVKDSLFALWPDYTSSDENLTFRIFSTLQYMGDKTHTGLYLSTSWGDNGWLFAFRPDGDGLTIVTPDGSTRSTSWSSVVDVDFHP